MGKKYYLRKVDSMSTMAMEMKSLKEFINQNKEKIRQVAEENTIRNSNGQVCISKNDPWFYEDEWDEHSKRMENNK